ncbi:Putative acyl-CoA dehydrogenase AidB [bacterium HR23]|nr:Putative acyl-CoA dehydrogenase AidB [bacterium HR23]
MNKPPVDNFYRADPLLGRLLHRTIGPEDVSALEPVLDTYGALCAGPFDREAWITDRLRPPLLVAHDPQGRPANQVVLHPGFEETLRRSCQMGIIAGNYRADVLGRRLPYTGTYTMAYLLGHCDVGARCILSLTGGTALVVSKFAPQPLRERYLPHLVSTGAPPIYYGGTFFTEQQGGSDLGANTTTARREEGSWRLYGEKWFCSNAGADIALVTARPEGAPPGVRGLALFLLPRRRDDGSPNRYIIRRLKDKMGTISVPTGEILLEGAEAHLIAGPGDGIKRAMEAVNFSRLDVALGSLGLLQRAILEATAFARERTAFGRRVQDFPMVQETLLDLMAEHSTTLAFTFRALHAFDQVHFYGEGDEVLMRLLAHLVKYRSSEVASQGTVRAMQVIGGNAYVEESPLPRLVRDALVMPIWEGTSNVQAWQALRLMADKKAHLPLLEDLRETLHRLPTPALQKERETIQAHLHHLEKAIAQGTADARWGEAHARRLADYLCDLASATYLLAQVDDTPLGKRLGALARWFLQKRLGPGVRPLPEAWAEHPGPLWDEVSAP